MIAVLRQDATQEQIESLCSWFREKGLDVHISRGEYQTILGLIGDTSRIDTDLLCGLSIIESATRVSEPYKSANRKFHPQDTVVSVSDTVRIGGGHFALIAGPCSVESGEQITTVAQAVQKAGAAILRGGAFKPRTSPYDFQGLGGEGIKMLSQAKQITGMPIVTEIMNANQLDLFEDVDIIQVGARNMQNFDLLKELGRCGKPILLKRGLSSTIKELLMSAEYIMAGGCEEVILCERGIRTFETYTRNTLDLSAIAVLQERTHLPVIVDPSHATGAARLVAPMARAAAAAGADGIMIEVHNDPASALCDGVQALTPEQFAAVAADVKAVRGALGLDK